MQERASRFVIGYLTPVSTHYLPDVTTRDPSVFKNYILLYIVHLEGISKYLHMADTSSLLCYTMFAYVHTHLTHLTES